MHRFLLIIEDISMLICHMPSADLYLMENVEIQTAHDILQIII